MARGRAVGDPGAMVGMRKVFTWIVIAVLVVMLAGTLLLDTFAA